MAVEKLHLDPPEGVLWICRRLHDAGFQCWAVGGAVRDRLTGHPTGDWDLTTSARPHEVQKLFRRTVPIGVDHGTVGVIARDGEMYEITTFRRDVENFGRRARVVFSDDLTEDLERRDFTINAVAWNPLTHEICDPHGGMADFQAGVLRTVGDPDERFAEDRLRVLRALRFAGRFDLRIDGATWSALQASTGLLDHLSMERIRDELWKVLAGPAPSRALDLYRTSGILPTVYPEIAGVAGHGGDVWGRVLRSVDAAGEGRTIVRAALLFRLGGLRDDNLRFRIDSETAETSSRVAFMLMRRLRTSNADTDRVTHLVARHADPPHPAADDATLRRWLVLVGAEHYRDLVRVLIALHRADGRGEGIAELFRRTHRMLRQGTPLSVRDLAIGGAELKALGLRPGPHYSEILEGLLQRVLAEPELNTRQRLLELVRAEIE